MGGLIKGKRANKRRHQLLLEGHIAEAEAIDHGNAFEEVILAMMDASLDITTYNPGIDPNSLPQFQQKPPRQVPQVPVYLDTSILE